MHANAPQLASGSKAHQGHGLHSCLQAAAARRSCKRCSAAREFMLGTMRVCRAGSGIQVHTDFIQCGTQVEAAGRTNDRFPGLLRLPTKWLILPPLFHCVSYVRLADSISAAGRKVAWYEVSSRPRECHRYHLNLCKTMDACVVDVSLSQGVNTGMNERLGTGHTLG